MTTYKIAPWILGLALAGCAGNGELVPAPGANAMPAPYLGAFESNAGVRLEVRTDAWSGVPYNLPDEMTPVLVHITNNSGQPLMIRYNDFSLRSVKGKYYAALPPFSIRKTVSVRPLYVNEGFAIAPYLGAYYPGWRRWDAWDFDELYYDRYYPEFVQLRLPTPSMLQAALPEGVIQPDGTAVGFLYFQHVPSNAGAVMLHQRLATPGGPPFGEITIPFRVD